METHRLGCHTQPIPFRTINAIDCGEVSSTLVPTQMGTGASHPVLKCPNGYDKEKFTKICKLFDKLDEDSNMGVSSDEMTEIAELHVKNCQTRLKARLHSISAAKARELEDLHYHQQHELDQLKKQHDAQAQVVVDQFGEESRQVQNTLDRYAALDEAGKSDTFMRVVGKDSQIDFWTFFEYMKSRTDDIKNIEF